MNAPHSEVYDIHTSFSKTVYGEKLSRDVRYDKYRPDHISKDEWVKLLGADVNNLTHMPLTYGIARAFINDARQHQPDLLNEGEEKLLLVAAISHDWAESITTDISYGDKTLANDEEEKLMFEQNVAQFYNGEDFDLVDQARREVVFNHDSKVGELLNAVERIGYLRTALRAHDILLAGVSDPELKLGLEWLIFDVFSNLQSKENMDSQPKLLELRKFSPVASYLRAVEYRVQDGFSTAITVMDSVLPFYGDKADLKREQMTHSAQNWNDYWQVAA
jgi:hypothetical protein